jgi:hypothetical protein
MWLGGVERERQRRSGEIQDRVRHTPGCVGDALDQCPVPSAQCPALTPLVYTSHISPKRRQLALTQTQRSLQDDKDTAMYECTMLRTKDVQKTRYWVHPAAAMFHDDKGTHSVRTALRFLLSLTRFRPSTALGSRALTVGKVFVPVEKSGIAMHYPRRHVHYPRRHMLDSCTSDTRSKRCVVTLYSCT